jgi:hypothetical protein
MRLAEALPTAIRIWFFSVTISIIMLGVFTQDWEFLFVLAIVAIVFTLPIPILAAYCIKQACLFSNSFAARLRNTYLLLIVLAGLFWAILYSFVEDIDYLIKSPSLLIGCNFLSILIACIFSIKQLKRLNDVTSEETVIS